MDDRQAKIEFILDHYEDPRNRGILEDAHVSQKGGNPGCGDIVTFYLKIDDQDRISDVKWEGEGCTISQAAASMVSEMIRGKTVAEVEAMPFDTVVDLVGREIAATRLKCATLGLQTAKDATRRLRAQRILGKEAADQLAAQGRAFVAGENL